MGIARHNLTGDTGTHIMLGYIVIAGTILLASAEDVTVMLNKGKLKGERMDYDFGQYYYAFKGIPYAKPPVKELRFMPPQEVDPWTEMLDATEDGSLCPQYDISQSLPIGDENCLSLNVYSPKLDSKKRAVMVYFHGGPTSWEGGPASSSGQDTSSNKMLFLSPSTTDLDHSASSAPPTRRPGATRGCRTRSWSSSGSRRTLPSSEEILTRLQSSEKTPVLPPSHCSPCLR